MTACDNSRRKKNDGVFVLGALCFLVAALVVMRFGIETRGSTLESVSG